MKPNWSQAVSPTGNGHLLETVLVHRKRSISCIRHQLSGIIRGGMLALTPCSRKERRRSGNARRRRATGSRRRAWRSCWKTHYLVGSGLWEAEVVQGRFREATSHCWSQDWRTSPASGRHARRQWGWLSEGIPLCSLSDRRCLGGCRRRTDPEAVNHLSCWEALPYQLRAETWGSILLIWHH